MTFAKLRSSVAVTSPPKEFRIFRAGFNEAEHDSATFDAKAAAEVMADYAKHGARVMIDLEHLSFARDATFDPDARGWCRLELRKNGELWAVDVEWTEEGAERIRSKKQRYLSPVFQYLKQAPHRIAKLVNIALTALPATHEPFDLAIARMNGRKATMATTTDPTKTLAQIAKLLGLPDGARAEAIADAVLALGFDPTEEDPDLAHLPATPAEMRMRAALTQREIAMCKTKGIDLGEYVKTRAAIKARSPAAKRT